MRNFVSGISPRHAPRLDMSEWLNSIFGDTASLGLCATTSVKGLFILEYGTYAGLACRWSRHFKIGIWASSASTAMIEMYFDSPCVQQVIPRRTHSAFRPITRLLGCDAQQFSRHGLQLQVGGPDECGRTTMLTAVTGSSYAQQQCSCGYSVTSPANNETSVYSNAMEVDFLHLYKFQGSNCFRPDQRNQSEPGLGAPYGKMFDPANVIPNPYEDGQQWNGTTVNGGEPGLSLYVRSKPVDTGDRSKDQMVPVGEISTPRDDIEYGSYRVNMKLPSLAGTVVGFFWVSIMRRAETSTLLTRSSSTSTTPKR